MNDDERFMLADDSREVIDQVFATTDHTEKIKSIGPIELDAHIFDAPSTDFARLIPMVYDRAFVEATIEHVDGDEFLQKAKITLFVEGKSPLLKTELTLTADETDDEEFDPRNPQYLLRSPITKQESEDTFIPLNSEICKKILDGLVGQANEFKAITAPERSFIESIRALLEVAKEKQIEREGSYRIQSSDQVGFVDIAVGDTQLHIDGQKPIHTYHHATIERHLPLGDRDSSLTMLQIKAGRNAINATFGLNYFLADDGEKIEQYEQMIQREIEEYNDPSNFYPSKFTHYLLSGLRTLEAKSPGEDIQRKTKF